MRRAALGLCAAAAYALAPSALADPPHTCGRIVSSSQTYVIRAHRVTCTFATRSARTFFSIGAAPRGYKCRATTGSVALTCTHRVRRSRYFLASTVA